MLDIIEIEFKGRRREDFRNPMEFPFKIGDFAVVEVEKGEHIGVVSNFGIRNKSKNADEIQYNIIRKATPVDLKTLCEIHRNEMEAMNICREKVANHGLPMKLIDSEFQFDMKKLSFYFTADGRVDFRELVKDLAGHFRVRIDLRQIGARDETKRLGGLGVCGLQLCCTSFISCFLPVTTQMAKVQNLSPNPQKLSGTCGRLKCCLRYELEQYIEEVKKYPTKESVFQTSQGIGIVEKIDIFSECVHLRFENGEIVRFTPQDILQCKRLKEGPPIEVEYPENGEIEEEACDEEDSGDDNSQCEQKKPAISSSDDSEPQTVWTSKLGGKYTTPFPSDFND